MRRNRAFWAALSVSLLIHLSMVTLFRIVILFPKDDIHYFQVRIVEATPEIPAVAPAPREELRVSSPDEAFDRLGAEDPLNPAEEFARASAPAVELPTIEFAGQDLLRIRREGLEVRSQYEELFPGEPRDTWERFGRGLANLGDAVTRAMAGRSVGENEPQQPVSQPAPGFEAYIEWMDPPQDREAVAIDKIEALWGLDPAALREPIVLFFEVNPEGKVVSILPQMEDDEGLVLSAINALFKFRFEPLSGEQTGSQNGTFIVSAAENAR